MPGLREDQPGAGAVPCRSAGLGGPEPAGDDRVREVRPASAAQPAGRPLCARGRADRALHHGRRRGRGRNGAGSPPAHGRGPCHGGRAPARRRHDRAGADQRQDRHGAALDLRPRRWAVRRARPPAAIFHYSRDRRGEHPQAHLAGYAGILQADAYDGYNKLYLPDRKPGPILEAACWSHARRKFFVFADVEENARRKALGKSEIPLSPIAIEVVRRIDALFAIEREINGKSPEERLAVRRAESRPLSTISWRTCASRRPNCRAGTTS